MLKNKMLSAMGGAPANYIEDVFSTWLYTGNGSTQTITNGIDLAGEGGMVWVKSRSQATRHCLFDTARGAYQLLSSDQTFGSVNTSPYDLTAFNSNGFSLGESGYGTNASGQTYASWTFRKQPKFFDVVTWVGNGTNQTVSHSLGSLPGCIIYKRTDSTSDWFVSTRNSAGNYEFLKLNTTAASVAAVNPASLDVTATSFDPLRLWGNVNGASYVAYLFAHDAGGFGLSGEDNVISCGSYAGTGSANNNINLGYEAQWVLIKNTTSAGNGWILVDNMCGGLSETTYAYLQPNTSGAEVAGSGASLVCATATGFRVDATGGAFNASGDTYIYIAIRRGPMKTPTSGTSVFSPVARAGTSTATTVTTGFPVDFIMSKGRNPSVGLGENWGEFDRLRGLAVLSSNKTGTEFTSPTYQLGIADFANNTGMNLSASDNDYGYINKSGYNYGTYFFRRAPSFFDEVCYTGTGSARTVAHNLGVAPELMIVKSRSAGGFDWVVYAQPQGSTKAAYLNDAQAFFTFAGAWNNTNPTSTVFTLGNTDRTNYNGATFVAYLFASCPGVSKCGSYTGTGTTQQINCGFTGGARFVMIKRTDSTGAWYVWDSARGIVAGNDPYLLLNSTAAEVTSTDYIDTYSAGFEISSTAPAAINASGGTFIFLAIA